MEIKLEKPSRFKALLHKLHTIAENILFAIIKILPEKLVPQCFIDWLGKYLQKQIVKKNQELIRSRWEDVALSEALEKIQAQQSDK